MADQEEEYEVTEEEAVYANNDLKSALSDWVLAMFGFRMLDVTGFSIVLNALDEDAEKVTLHGSDTQSTVADQLGRLAYAKMAITETYMTNYRE